MGRQTHIEGRESCEAGDRHGGDVSTSQWRINTFSNHHEHSERETWDTFSLISSWRNQPYILTSRFETSDLQKHNRKYVCYFHPPQSGCFGVASLGNEPDYNVCSPAPGPVRSPPERCRSWTLLSCYSPPLPFPMKKGKWKFHPVEFLCIVNGSEIWFSHVTHARVHLETSQLGSLVNSRRILHHFLSNRGKKNPLHILLP